MLSSVIDGYNVNQILCKLCIPQASGRQVIIKVLESGVKRIKISNKFSAYKEHDTQEIIFST